MACIDAIGYNLIAIYKQSPVHVISSLVNKRNSDTNKKNSNEAKKYGTEVSVNNIIVSSPNVKNMPKDITFSCSFDNFQSPTTAIKTTPKLPKLELDKLSISDNELSIMNETQSTAPDPNSREVDKTKKKSKPTKSLQKPGLLSKKLQKKDNKKVNKSSHFLANNNNNNNQQEEDIDILLDEYFNNKNKKSLTSNNTLVNLNRPRLNHRQAHELISLNTKTQLIEMRTELLNKYQYEYFPTWIDFHLLDMNVIVYGVGSKRSLIERFIQAYALNHYHLVINGYFPEISLKHILNQLTRDLMGSNNTFRTLQEHVEFILDEFGTTTNNTDIHTNNTLILYIIVHNICGASLRTVAAQNILSQLASAKRIHMIATLDHIRGPLMWDPLVLSRFTWVWQHCPTYLPYNEETSFENSFFMQQSGSMALTSLVHVMESLTPNARNIFKLLAQHKIDSHSRAYKGIPFYDLYANCRAHFYVNSEQTLKSQLIEFKDHKIIKTKKSTEGIENLIVCIDETTLKIFFEEHVNL